MNTSNPKLCLNCIHYNELTTAFTYCFYNNKEITVETRKQSEPAHLRQDHVVRQVAAPSSV